MPIEIEVRTIGEIDYLIIDGRVLVSATTPDKITFRDIVSELESSEYINLKFTEDESN